MSYTQTKSREDSKDISKKDLIVIKHRILIMKMINNLYIWGCGKGGLGLTYEF